MTDLNNTLGVPRGTPSLPGSGQSKPRKWLILFAILGVTAAGALAMLFGKSALFKGSLLEASDFAEDMLNNYAVLDYDFESLGAENTLPDKSTIGNSAGKVFGTPALIEEGYLGKALSFDGDDYILFEDALQSGELDLGTRDVTFMWWMKADPEDGSATLIDKDFANNTGYGFSINGGKLNASISDGQGGFVSLVPEVDDPLLNDNLWHHVALALNRNAKLFSLYVDGTSAQEVRFQSLGNVDTEVPFIIGASKSANSAPWIAEPRSPYKGFLDEFKVLTTALDASGIKNFYDVEHAAHWGAIEEEESVFSLDFEEVAEDGGFIDVSGNENVVVNHDGTQEENFGIAGNAVRLNGHEQYLEVGTLDPAILPDGDGTITALAQFKLVEQADVRDPNFQPAPVADTKTVFAYGSNDQTQGLRVGTKWGANTLSLYFGEDGSLAENRCDTNITTVDDTQHYLALVKEGRNLTFYIDGDAVCKKELAAYPKLSSTLLIGADKTDAHFMNGYVDDVKVYNRALSVEEIAAAYSVYSPDVIGDGDMLYLNADGDELADLSPFEHELETENVEIVDDGLGDSAFKLEGSPAFIKIADHDSLDIGKDDFSISYWAKNPATDGIRNVFLNKAQVFPNIPLIPNGSSNRGWLSANVCGNSSSAVFGALSGAVLDGEVNMGNNPGDETLFFVNSSEPNKNFCDNKWHYYNFVLDRDGSAKIYIDDEMIGENRLAKKSVLTNFTSPDDLIIGKSAGNQSIYAIMDELRIRRIALSEETIKAEFAAGKAELEEKGLIDRAILSYNFNSDERDATDFSGFGNDGTLHEVTWINEGVNGGAYQYPNVDGAYIMTEPSWNLKVKNAISTEAVLKCGENANGKLLNIINENEEIMILNFNADCANSTLKLEVANGEATPENENKYTVEAEDVEFEEWNHLVATYELDGSARLYLNGQLLTQQEVIAPIYTGLSESSVSVGPFRNGILDEVNVYNYALTPAEILEHYSALSVLFPANLLSNEWVAYREGEVEKTADPTVPDASNAPEVLSVSSDNGGGAQQYQIPVLAGYSYKLKLQYNRVQEASAGIWMGFNTSDEDIDLNPFWDSESTGWTNYEREIIISEEGTLSVVLAAKDGQVLFKDISLTVASPVSDSALERAGATRVARGPATPESASQVRDSDMSAEGVTEWKFIGGAPLTTLEKAEEDGNIVLHAAGSGAGINQTGLVLDSKFVYKFSFRQKNISGRTTAYIIWNKKDSGSSTIPSTVTEITGRRDWRTYEKEFSVTGEGTASLVLKLDDGGEAYFDDVTITKVKCLDEKYLLGDDGKCFYIPQGCPVHVPKTLDMLFKSLKRSNYNTTQTQYNVLKEAYSKDCPTMFDIKQMPEFDTLPAEPTLRDTAGNPVPPVITHVILVPEFDPGKGPTFLSITIDQPVNKLVVKILKHDGTEYILKSAEKTPAGLLTQVWDGFFTENETKVKAPVGMYPYVIAVENENGQASVTGMVKVSYVETPVTPGQTGTQPNGTTPVPTVHLELKPEKPCNVYFADVTVDDPDCDAAAWLYEKGIMTGSPNPTGGLNLFKADQSLRRAEFVAVSNNIAGFADEAYTLEEGNLGFWDLGVPNDSTLWIFRELKKAVRTRGPLYPPVIQGYKDGSFKANNQITNAELWKVILESLRNGGKAKFSLQADTSQVPWFKDYFRFLSSRNLVSTRADPMRYTTRREAAMLLYAMAFEGLY